MKAHAARGVRQWGSCGMAKRKTKGASPATGGTGVLGTVLWLVAICAWILVTAALLSYNPADSPSHLVARHHEAAANWVGPFGALVAHKIYLMLGPGVWLLVIGSGAWMCLTTIPTGVSALNGVLPVAISYSTTPSE